jgi:hypothetical protein
MKPLLFRCALFFLETCYAFSKISGWNETIFALTNNVARLGKKVDLACRTNAIQISGHYIVARFVVMIP